jgi:hypothetical protein
MGLRFGDRIGLRLFPLEEGFGEPWFPNLKRLIVHSLFLDFCFFAAGFAPAWG